MNSAYRATLRSNVGKYVALFVISALVCLLLCGAFSAAYGLEYTADRYFDNSGLYDVCLRSDTGFSEDDIRTLTEQSGGSVTAVFSTDLPAEVGGKPSTLRVYSIDDGANRLNIVQGRMPMSDKECVADAATFKLNSTVKLLTDEEQPTIKNGELRVVGLFESPMYLTDGEYGKSGDEKIDGVLYINKTNFTLPNYTDIFISYDTLAEHNCFDANYKSGIASVLARIKTINDDRIATLYGEQMNNLEYTLAENKLLIEQYNTEIKFYEDNIKGYEDKIDDLEPQMKKLRKYLDDYAKLVGISSEDVIVYVESYMQTLDTLSVQIKQLEDEFLADYATYNEAAFEYSNKSGEVNNNYNNELVKINSSDMDDAKKAAEIKKLDEKYAKQFKELKAEKEALDKEYDRVAKMSSDLDSLKQSYNSILAELRSNDINTDSATINIENYYKLELNYSSMKAERDMLQSSLDFLEQSYADEIEVINSNIAAALAENEEQQRLLDEYKSNRWAVYQRSDSAGYAALVKSAASIRAIAWICLPYISAVAVLLFCLVMVLAARSGRRQMGVLRSLGLSSAAVTGAYAGFAASAAAYGGLLGAALGSTVVPLVQVILSRSTYNLPSIALGFDYVTVGIIFAAAVIAAAAIGAVSALVYARKQPSELLFTAQEQAQ